jgi:AcrR family transcriptional regulator
VARPNLSEQTREQIVTAAIAVLDGDGVEALSMRRLATVVGIRSPTLYHYFESKSALLNAIKEQIADEIWTSVEARLVDLDPGDWQAALRGYVEGAAAAMAKHPNAVDLMALRKVSNRRTLAGYERMLEALTSAGWTLPSAWRAFPAAENLMLSGGAGGRRAALHTEPGRGRTRWRGADPRPRGGPATRSLQAAEQSP